MAAEFNFYLFSFSIFSQYNYVNLISTYAALFERIEDLFEI